MRKDKSMYFTGIVISYEYGKQNVLVSVYMKAFVLAEFAHSVISNM